MLRSMNILFIWMLYITVANSAYTPCTLCIDEASPDEYSKIKLILYTGPSTTNYTSVGVDDALELYSKMDNSRPTVVFVSGWISTPKTASDMAIVNAYLSRQDHNVILLDWSVISVTVYSYATRSVEGVGYNLAIALNKLVAHGLHTTGLHIIGHSLGAQICGYAGRNVNFTLPRIIGLDPAGPGFYLAATHLTYKDAQFVAIIHTDRHLLGINLSTGHVDFYPNDGISVQSGCPNILLISNICSHYKSVYFYAQSVHNESSFIGYACDSYSKFKAGECNLNPTALMGYATPTDARGSFYLDTGSEPLYGQEDGFSLVQELAPAGEFALEEHPLIQSFLRLIGLV